MKIGKIKYLNVYHSKRGKESQKLVLLFVTLFSYNIYFIKYIFYLSYTLTKFVKS